MNSSYIIIGVIVVFLVLALFQVFANAQTVDTSPDTTSQITDEKTCGSCCGGNCGSCCTNGVCSKSTKGTSSCGC